MPDLSATIERFVADPAAARSVPTVTATLQNGHARLASGDFNWDSDLPIALGGQALAPSPTVYLLGALAGCAVALLADSLAPEFRVRVDGVTAVASCRSDVRGLLGFDGVAADLDGVSLEIQVDSPDPEVSVRPMLDAWEARCPIYLALRKPLVIAFSARTAATAYTSCVDMSGAHNPAVAGDLP